MTIASLFEPQLDLLLDARFQSLTEKIDAAAVSPTDYKADFNMQNVTPPGWELHKGYCLGATGQRISNSDKAGGGSVQKPVTVRHRANYCSSGSCRAFEVFTDDQGNDKAFKDTFFTFIKAVPFAGDGTEGVYCFVKK